MGTNWVSPSNVGLNGNIDPGFNLANFFQSPTGGAALSGLGGLAGFFPTPASGSSSTSSTLNTGQDSSGKSKVSGTGTTSGTTTTGYGPAGSTVISQILPQLQSLLQGTNLSTSYLPQQTQQINTNANLQKKALDNVMASRGLSTSPAAATAQVGVEQNRINQITGLQQQLPLLQNQLNANNLGTAGGILSQLPQVNTTAGTTGSTQTGSSSASNNATQTGSSNTNSNQNSGGGLGGLFGGIASTLASLFA